LLVALEAQRALLGWAVAVLAVAVEILGTDILMPQMGHPELVIMVAVQEMELLQHLVAVQAVTEAALVEMEVTATMVTEEMEVALEPTTVEQEAVVVAVAQTQAVAVAVAEIILAVVVVVGGPRFSQLLELEKLAPLDMEG
jgi:hypothetical protein